jgi:hypothetical protein
MRSCEDTHPKAFGPAISRSRLEVLIGEVAAARRMTFNPKRYFETPTAVTFRASRIIIKSGTDARIWVVKLVLVIS